MIDFVKNENLIIARYEPQGGAGWIYSKLSSYENNVLIKKTFRINESNLFDEDETFDESSGFVMFKFAILEGDYYKVVKSILNISFDVYIHKSLNIKQNMFIVKRNVSIFSVIEKIKPIEDIYIGGSNEKAILIEEYMAIIKALPNSYELEKYSTARVSSVLRKYFETNVDGLSQYEKYINGKQVKKPHVSISEFNDFDLVKYQYTIDKLNEMLKNEEEYSENDWQDEILKIVTILFPKYIKAIKEAPVMDFVYNKPRRIDILLVDADGSVDIIEIKKPFEQCIVSNGKYRDNYIPLRDLSGTIMQVEKYIYHLNKCGIKGESDLAEKYKDIFPDGFKLKITNPKGIIIMGRSNNLTNEQNHDFEIIKRKYSNILDIMTYDDLIQRLDTIKQNLSMHITKGST